MRIPVLSLLFAVCCLPLSLAAAPPSDAELARWERMRITSARRAARLAAVNTALGRPAGTLTDAGRRAAIGAALATPSARALAWLYTMGLDRAA